MKGGSCITHTASCRLSYGENVTGVADSDGGSLCSCKDGFSWNSNGNACVEIKSPATDEQLSQEVEIRTYLVRRIERLQKHQERIERFLELIKGHNKEEDLRRVLKDMLGEVERMKKEIEEKL